MKHTDELWMKANTIRASQIANGMDYNSLKDIFAELIVRECADWLSHREFASPEALKHHFGVE